MNKIKEIFIKEKSSILIAMVMGLVFTISFSIVNYTRTYAYTIQENIANEVVRFHVLANSNSEDDQDLKVLVKDKILEKYKNDLIENSNRDDMLVFMEENIVDIENYAKEIIKAEGYSYKVKAGVKEVMFPTKIYGDVKLPAGKYTALQIEIGSAIGENWWCVMYPPLCYVDVTVEATEKLKEDLSEEEFALVTEDSKKVELEFKVVEYWGKMNLK